MGTVLYSNHLYQFKFNIKTKVKLHRLKSLNDIENPTISYKSYSVYVWYLVLSNAERSPDQAPFFADHDHTCLLCYSSIRNCIQRCCYLMTGISIHDDCRRRALTRWRRLLLQLRQLELRRLLRGHIVSKRIGSSSEPLCTGCAKHDLVYVPTDDWLAFDGKLFFATTFLHRKSSRNVFVKFFFAEFGKFPLTISKQAN